MKHNTHWLFLLLLVCVIPGVHAQSLKAGAAMRIITPDPLLPASGGIGTPRPTTDKRGELSVRALVFDSGDTAVALVAVDNLGWPAYWGDKTRKRVSAIPPENIIIAATHTHSAPDAYCFPDLEGKHHADLNYLEWVCVQAADAINEAWEKRQPARLKIAVGKAEGKIAYNYYAPQLYDPRCGVIQAVASASDGAEKVIATFVNYAIHPEVLGSDKGIISPDLCGPFYDRIESKAGGIALFMNSAQGGMVTADNRSERGDMEIWEECVRIGELLADEALRIVADAEEQEQPVLHCSARIISLPVENILMQLLMQSVPMADPLGEYDKVKTQVNLLSVGTAQLLTIPGEALPNIGFYLKRKMPARHPFLLGLANDAFGYMLTKYDFNSFERYDYISETSLGEMAAEKYVEEALDLIKSSPAPDRPLAK
jgi:hypothetical protein